MSREQGRALPWEFPDDQAALEARDCSEITTEAVYSDLRHVGTLITCTCEACVDLRAYNASPAGRAAAERIRREAAELAAEDALEQKRRHAAAEANRGYRRSQLEQSA